MSTTESGTVVDMTRQGKHNRPMLLDLVVRLIKEKPLGTFGIIILLGALLTAILADVISPYPMDEMNLMNRLSPPSAEHWLGTDNVGRDLLTRVIYGARVSVIVGLAVPITSVIVSLVIGVLSGFLGGKFDIIVQRFVDAWMAFPSLIITLTVMSLLGQGLLQVIIVLGISGGIGGSRTIRGTVLGIKENVYIEAASAIGAPVLTIIVRHILPNIMAVVIVLFTVRMAGAILAEAAISFLGFGIPPPNPSWGGMLSGSGRRFMLKAPWLALWPGLCLSVVVYGVSMLGDAVRDLLDPRLRGGLGRYGKATKGRK